MLISLVIAGCGQVPELRSGAVAQIVRSEKQRQEALQVADVDMPALVNGNNGFALDLYQVLRKRDGNLFFSPYSISQALAMTYAGAREQTGRQMAAALHFSLSQERLHPAFNALDQAITARGKAQPNPISGEDVPGFTLKTVNAIWGQTGYTFQPPFLDMLAENYGAGLQLLDFAQAPEDSRATINDWVSDQTGGKLRDLIPQGAIDRLTRLVLANAISFEGAWSYPFREEDTAAGQFQLLDDSTATVPMMKRPNLLRYSYAEGSEYQAIELDYVPGAGVTMLILLPASGRFEAFESSLDAGRLDEIVWQLSDTEVKLAMPKFTYTSPSVSLKQTLGEMGMLDAFKPKVADFSGMDGTHLLYLGDVFHQASVSVSEKGTQAVAATAVIVQLVSAIDKPPVELTIDRPFIFLIRDRSTGVILFVGRVLDPRG
jgi:serpin B